MKTKFNKMFLMVTMSALIVSCGKGNSSSGSSKDSGINKFSETKISEVSLRSVQDKFNKLNTASNGAKADDIIYHVGPYYAPQSTGGSFSFQTSGCINLIFTQIGDCNTSGGTPDSYWRSIINGGSYKLVKNVSTSRIDYEKLIDVRSGTMYYELFGYAKSTSEVYKSMLDLNGSGFNMSATKASVAEITLVSGDRVEAYLVEKFDGYRNYKYVVSPKLPLLANPVAILDGYGQFIGALKGVGNKRIKTIKINYHTQGYNGQVVRGGFRQITLN